jgi:hypothetical protein
MHQVSGLDAGLKNVYGSSTGPYHCKKRLGPTKRC